MKTHIEKSRLFSAVCRPVGCSLFLCVLSAANAQPKTELKQETVRAFEQYAGEFEKNIDAAVRGRKPFLWILDQDPDKLKSARSGEILIFKPDRNVDVPDGMIHVWGVSAFIDGVKAEDAAGLLIDYDRHKNVYPSVIDSKLIGKNGDTVRGSLQFKYKKVLTVVLNTEHEAESTALDEGRHFIRVRSSRIAQVEDYEKPEEHELPPGRDSGFMWRLNTYWFLEPHRDGVLLECRSLTLTRRIPFGLSWIVGPFVESIPRDSLKELVEGTRRYFSGRTNASGSGEIPPAGIR
ncbi:MAG: hypothetical protein JW793_03245 [Acidobacteria bacterium]|nr:hypothetical protein [Acidobacteriota bacterium]